MRIVSVSLLVLGACVGCQGPSAQPVVEAPPAAAMSAPSEAAMSAPAGLEARVGYLARFPMQHPQVSPRDSYLDIYDSAGELERQIIVIFPADNAPDDKERPIKVEGTVQIIDLGGEPGTKMSYKGEALTVTRWEYLEPGAVPRAQPGGAGGP